MNTAVQRALSRAKGYGASTQGVTERRTRHEVTDRILLRYCQRKGVNVCDVLNKQIDRKSVTLRAALMYLTWKEAEPHICIDYPKSRVYSDIGKIFGMKRINVLERLEVFASDVEYLRSVRDLLTEIEQLIEKPLD